VPIIVLGFGGYMLAHHPDRLVPATAPAATSAAIASSAPSASSAPADAQTPAVTVLTQEEREKQSKFNLGWPAAFLITPALAVIWIVLWVTLYRPPEKSRRANAAEVSLIQADAPPATGAPVKWRNLLPHRQAWAFMMGKFLTDPIWWFYLFWSGKFFYDNFHLHLSGLAGPLILIYVLADIGSIAGGYLSSALINHGWTPNAARKTTMSICAGLILPVIMAPMIPSTWIAANGFQYGMWMAATLIGVAAAAHQGFSATIFTTTSDMFPKRAISSVVGLGGLAGALSGMVMQAVAGVIKEVTKSYLIMFIIAGTVYILAVVTVHLLAPRLQPVDERDLETKPMPLTVTGILGAVAGVVLGVPLSFLLQPRIGFASHFGKYIASIITGDIFKGGSAVLIPRLTFTPLGAAVCLAIVGIALHAMLAKPSRGAAA
jgi:nitrate/nitrite transporter NarK